MTQNSLTTEQFILKARQVHGWRFNYSKVNYINNHTKVCIICPEHGEFWQTPEVHFKGCGCPKCARKNFTTEQFIEKAKEIHGDKYDYSKSEYVGPNKNVCIICAKHGEFWQRIDVHLHGSGCPICAKKGRTVPSLSEFIKKARETHGDKYDYSKVDLTNVTNMRNDKVCIVCPEHGEFWQRPYNHLSGQGCKKCAIETESKKRKPRNDTNWFIEKARKIHGDKYDYSKTEYLGYRKQVRIICPEHGEFWQMAYNHLYNYEMRKYGCPICSKINNATKLREKYSTDWFIKKAREVHGDKYDYSKTEYVDSKVPVCITCPIHGDFMQIPNQHLFGYGCVDCAHEEHRCTTEEFIEKARKIHGDKYDYSKTEYVTNRVKVCITCPKHGEFWKEPVKHLSGSGCPICKESTLEKDIATLLDNNHINYEREKRFEWLRNISLLSLDFYLPDTSIAIECQGIQHFEPREFFGGYEGYVKTVERDTLKRKLCEEHGIKILYFTDDDIDTSSYDDIECTVYTNTQELLTEIYNHKVNGTT